MRTRTDHLTLAALAALGALLVHQLAYLVATSLTGLASNIGTDHGHLSTQWALVTPVAAIAAAVFVLRQVRNLHLGSSLSRWHLAVGSGSLFLAQEIIEGHLGGEGALAVLSHPAAGIGIALAPLVGMAMGHLLNEASELMARFLRVPASIHHSRSPLLRPPAGDAAPSLCDLVGTPSRGPPAVRL